MKLKIILILGLFLSSFVWSNFAIADELIDRQMEGTNDEKNPVTARTLIMNSVMEKASEDVIKEVIGEAKYNRNKAVIREKIIKNSSRFIPFSRPGELTPKEEGFKLSVALKINVTELQKMLLEQGLFYEQDSAPMVLPFIAFTDEIKGETFSWWQKTDSQFLQKQSRRVEDNLRSSLWKQNFYLVKPAGWNYKAFSYNELDKRSLSLDEQQAFAQKMNAQVFINGEVNLSTKKDRSIIRIRWTAIQAVNQRVIAEVNRGFEAEKGASEILLDRKLKEAVEVASQDLASQILEAWKRGSLGASLYKLTVRGRLPLEWQENLKGILKNRAREIKNVRERLISTEQITYEIDSSITPKDLGAKVPELVLGNQKLVLESSGDSELTYKVARP